jgi:hypothetical protein
VLKRRFLRICLAAAGTFLLLAGCSPSETEVYLNKVGEWQQRWNVAIYLRDCAGDSFPEATVNPACIRALAELHEIAPVPRKLRDVHEEHAAALSALIQTQQLYGQLHARTLANLKRARDDHVPGCDHDSIVLIAGYEVAGFRDACAALASASARMDLVRDLYDRLRQLR